MFTVGEFFKWANRKSHLEADINYYRDALLSAEESLRNHLRLATEAIDDDLTDLHKLLRGAGWSVIHNGLQNDYKEIRYNTENNRWDLFWDTDRECEIYLAGLTLSTLKELIQLENTNIHPRVPGVCAHPSKFFWNEIS